MGVRVSEEFNARLQKMADRARISKSELCRRVLEHAMNNGIQNMIGGVGDENE
jgi:predicted transcriptional regulator